MILKGESKKLNNKSYMINRLKMDVIERDPLLVKSQKITILTGRSMSRKYYFMIGLKIEN